MRRLIVNADDFGLTPGVNKAVVALHQAGALTSTTLMAAAPCYQEAVDLAQQNASLGVGCHIVLVDGAPLSPPETIPTLLDPDSRVPAFRSTLGLFLQDLLLGRIRTQDILLEATAQIQRLQSSGLTVTHCDTHKHTHMFPHVLEPVLRAARQCGVRGVRNPFEPDWSVNATPQANAMRRLEVQLLHNMYAQFFSKVRSYSMVTTDGCLGVVATGTLDAATIGAILDRMPEGTWELVCHPAYVDAELRATRTRLIDSRMVEVEALLATLARGNAKYADMLRISYGNLTV
ncbi:MAG TPA: ChbG/HpnK family deacetylase [Acidobacteriaceae bacterium]|jgi:hopanoid biosynthesis associated protein HpnK|nr:ChbG/HpnK family deacetylase [Acidobacteriaceae bacterium]